ncbi:MAG: DUF445 domain-containing protein [Anaerolineae bacterium]
MQLQDNRTTLHFQFGETPTQEREADLKRMKLVATSLLGLATAVFVVATIYIDLAPWVGFVQAAAEAAMVGAIADWFAVTALFRHPLGLKIPHTAIIPRRKDSLAYDFGLFVQRNFLSEEVVTNRLRGVNVAAYVANWITRPENSRTVADIAATAVRGLLQVVKDEDVQGIIENTMVSQIRAVQVSPLLGSILSMVTSGERKDELLNGALKLATNLMEENREDILARISQETPWWLPEAVDHRIYEKMVLALDNTLHEVNDDPNHPLHAKFGGLIDRLVADLQESPEMIDRGEALKEEFLQDPGVRDFASSLWLDVKTALLAHSGGPDSNLHRPIQDWVEKLGYTLSNDIAMQEKINQWTENALRYLVSSYGVEVQKLITYTISEWDPKATADKIELQVGKDLQFIRINGTLVGGLVGLLIHTASVLMSWA